MADGKSPLPPGWDMKFDARTGKHYYINHYTKTTSWEDPRERYQQIGKPTATNKENQRPDPPELKAPEHIPMQANNSMVPLTNQQVVTMRRELEAENLSSQSQDYRSQRASSPGTGRANTPQMGTASGYGHSQFSHATASPGPLARLQLDNMETMPYESPLSQRSTLRRDSHILAEISEMESSFSNQEQAIGKIAAMFPTVEESHIRELYKKYHGSQAVVMSALQVAKHPIATPGPASAYTPIPSRHATLPGVASGVLAGITMTGSLPYNFPPYMTPTMGARDMSSIDQSSGYPTPRPGTAASDLDNSCYMGSPQIGGTLFRAFPKPHSSPKMKLRYLKSVFPTVEEYLLLDVLANSENNVQKAADKLVKMGYVKRETPAGPRLHAKKKEEERLAEKRTPLPKPPPIKTEKEKEELRKKMKDKYEKKFEIPERILFMALESVLYDEDQANNLVTSMIEDDVRRQKAKEAEKMRERAEKKKSPKPIRRIEAERPKHTSPKHVPKPQGKRGFTKNTKVETPRISQGTNTQEARSGAESKTIAKGPNPALRQGPNDDLLLTDYVTWNGPNPELKKGANRSGAKGPNPEFHKGPSGGAKGPSSANRKGPQGLAKGSIYASLNADAAASRAI